uniref:Uncharacterized protein n=1 Tax=Ditylenchus dipsaci TaxID=166011 RepID=A0A915EFM4_9BILA
MYNSSDYISVSSNTLSSALSSQYYTQSDTEAEEEIRCRKRGGAQRPGTRLTLTPRETTLRKKRSLSSTYFPVCQQTPKALVQHAISRKSEKAFATSGYPPPVPRHQLEKPSYGISSSYNDSGCDDERLEEAHRSYEETNFMNMSDKTYENLRMEHRVSVAGVCEATASCSASSSSGACSRGTASDSAMSRSLAPSAMDDEPQLYGRLVGVVFTEARRLNPHNGNWRRIADAQRQLEAVFGLSRDTDLAQPFQQDVMFCKTAQFSVAE